MSRFAPLLGALLALSPVPALAHQGTAQAATSSSKRPVVILVSIDGFRADYLQRGITPNLSALAAKGISAAMRPSFPSKTFPNHWALVTGEYPDHNGIVGNTFEDPRRPGETFTMKSDDPFWWDEAEPIWVAAEKAGIRTATMFWPGSNIGWGGTMAQHGYPVVTGGTRPEDWQQYNGAVDATQRVNAVLDWMRRPAAIRPRLVTLYFDTVDTAGHMYGPDDARTNDAIHDVDSHIGDLVAGLKAQGIKADVIVVADHGMAAISSQRVVALDKVADPALYRIVDSGPFASLQPTEGNTAKLEAALLAPHDHMQCWRKGEIPARLHYGTNPRIAPYFCLAETGWQIAATAPTEEKTGGSHGWDNAAPEMAALFVAAGPDIERKGALPAFDNVDVEPLVRDLLGLAPKPEADGNDAPFKAALRK
ncbi:ectonucleotide pyrophosphatase/phosphodiesterase [Novosphingobium sp. 9]|uniref:alkaline phosphatase family protein n=1 Tax=Novosphingobium sp. 9 TaxID=2025349 RepID=UPI0021B574AB|nr:ectonucleotide pyrophosphatase/phosphodiesterase [Novosphingobium sp. 9]